MSFAHGSLVTERAFHQFGILPAELQQSIWKYAVGKAPPRVVEARWEGQRRGWISNTLCPPLLHVCGASRQLGRRRYEPVYFSKFFSRTYIDWETDTVVFEPDVSTTKANYHRLRDVSSKSFFENCRNFAISCKNIGNVRLLRPFKNLQHIQILFFSKFGPLRREGDLAFRDFELGCFSTVYDRIRREEGGTHQKVSTCHAIRDKDRRLKGKAKRRKWKRIKHKVKRAAIRKSAVDIQKQ